MDRFIQTGATDLSVNQAPDNLPPPPSVELREEPQIERVMTACAGAFASCLAWLPSLALPFWGDDLARLGMAKSLIAGGASWGEWIHEFTREGSSVLGAIWWKALASTPTPDPQFAHVLTLLVHLLAAAMVGVLTGAVLRRIAPLRPAARAGSLAAFLYGIHPGHFLALQSVDGAMASFFALLAAAALCASLPGDRESPRAIQRAIIALVASIGAVLIAPTVALLLPMVAFPLNKVVRSEGPLPHRTRNAFIAWVVALGIVAIIISMNATPTEHSFFAGSARVLGGFLGVPGESLRRLGEGSWFSAVVMILLCGGIQGVVLSSSAFWARNILPGDALATPARLAVFACIVIVFIPGLEQARIHLLLIGTALVIGLAFAVRLRAKALLAVISIVGALFASEFERLSPWPATLERARVAGQVTRSMNEWQLGERRLRGEFTRVSVICADDVLWQSLGGEVGVANTLRVERDSIQRVATLSAADPEGSALLELTYTAARTPVRDPVIQPTTSP